MPPTSVATSSTQPERGRERVLFSRRVSTFQSRSHPSSALIVTRLERDLVALHIAVRHAMERGYKNVTHEAMGETPSYGRLVMGVKHASLRINSLRRVASAPQARRIIFRSMYSDKFMHDWYQRCSDEFARKRAEFDVELSNYKEELQQDRDRLSRARALHVKKKLQSSIQSLQKRIMTKHAQVCLRCSLDLLCTYCSTENLLQPLHPRGSLQGSRCWPDPGLHWRGRRTRGLVLYGLRSVLRGEARLHLRWSPRWAHVPAVSALASCRNDCY